MVRLEKPLILSKIKEPETYHVYKEGTWKDGVFCNNIGPLLLVHRQNALKTKASDVITDRREISGVISVFLTSG